MRSTHRAKVVPLLVERDGGMVCFYCERPIDDGQDVALRQKATVDHVIPRTDGGPSQDWNLVLSCYACNRRKGIRDGMAFLRDVVRRTRCERDKAKARVLSAEGFIDHLKTFMPDDVYRRAAEEWVAARDRAAAEAIEDELADIDRRLAEGWVPESRPVDEAIAELRRIEPA